MKIAYVSTYDPYDVHAWSGLGNYILRSLQNAGIETEIIGGLKYDTYSRMLTYAKKGYYKLLSRNYLRDRETRILKQYAAQVNLRLASIKTDIVFSPGTIPISFLETDKPIVFWTDASFAGMIDFYPEFSKLCNESIKNGTKVEQSALTKSSLAVYSSSWAANTAIQSYDIDPEKVKVVPFGANIKCARNSNDLEVILNKKESDICKLLFVGVSWDRKGGEKALSVAKLLNQRGVKTELHIVGCSPPFPTPTFVKKHGFISKKTQEGRNYLDRLFSDAHFFILPSQAECYGVVFAEASSFGLPSLATNVGGITTVIHNDVNGRTFELGASAEEYCDYIQILMESPNDYRNLARSSLELYTNKLNWDIAGKDVYNHMSKLFS